MKYQIGEIYLYEDKDEISLDKIINIQGDTITTQQIKNIQNCEYDSIFHWTFGTFVHFRHIDTLTNLEKLKYL